MNETNPIYPEAVKYEEIARALAQQERLSKAMARDRVDEVVHKVLKQLRKGQPVVLPGVGRLANRPPGGSR